MSEQDKQEGIEEGVAAMAMVMDAMARDRQWQNDVMETISREAAERWQKSFKVLYDAVDELVPTLDSIRLRELMDSFWIERSCADIKNWWEE